MTRGHAEPKFLVTNPAYKLASTILVGFQNFELNLQQIQPISVLSSLLRFSSLFIVAIGIPIGSFAFGLPYQIAFFLPGEPRFNWIEPIFWPISNSVQVLFCVVLVVSKCLLGCPTHFPCISFDVFPLFPLYCLEKEKKKRIVRNWFHFVDVVFCTIRQNNGYLQIRKDPHNDAGPRGPVEQKGLLTVKWDSILRRVEPFLSLMPLFMVGSLEVVPGAALII